MTTARRWWAPFITGAAAGFAAGVILGIRRGDPGVEDGEAGPDEVGRPDDGWPERAWAGARRGLGQAREILTKPVPPDLESLRRRLAALPSSEGVRVRDLGDGIVEVVGSAADDAAARVLLDVVAAEPGVEVVVNRVWTPSSAAPNVSGL